MSEQQGPRSSGTSGSAASGQAAQQESTADPNGGTPPPDPGPDQSGPGEQARDRYRRIFDDLRVGNRDAPPPERTRLWCLPDLSCPARTAQLEQERTENAAICGS